MIDAPTIETRPLSEDLLADYLRFFDEKAFTDNPRWAFCFCYFPYHDPAKIDWQKRTGPENREAISACVRDGTAQGYLAYAGNEVVGWCNAAPRRLYPMLNDPPEPDADTTGAITCFIIAPSHRERGIARSLLAAACDGLRTRGMRAVEARPVKDARGPAANHHGPLSLYLAAGFSIVREDDDGTMLVRKDLERMR
jgi:ribosomal protein S18 acetylase RimI-like enzyme